MSELLSLLVNPYLLATLAILFAIAAIVINIFVGGRRANLGAYSDRYHYDMAERQIESIRPSRHEPRSISLVKFLTIIISIIAAIIAALSLYLSFPRLTEKFGSPTFNLIPYAIAEQANSSTPLNPSIAGMVPYILAGVFVIMILAFSVSVITLLALPSIDSNERRLSAADNIVKTFGGFFIGFATSLLNLGH